MAAPAPDGDHPAAREALRCIGDWLGIGAANLINPGVVIFGGMLRDVYPGAAEQVRARIASNVLPVARERVRLRTSALGDAAELGFAELLADPLGALTRAVASPVAGSGRGRGWPIRGGLGGGGPPPPPPRAGARHKVTRRA
ncbi:hypothetical protein ACFT41_16130, partial [Micromonospora sp. NPDC057141]